MKFSKQYLPKGTKKIAEVSLSAYSVPSASPQKSPSGAMVEKQASPLESEVERISRNWDIGKRVCRCYN
jgi:hypothetical protein